MNISSPFGFDNWYRNYPRKKSRGSAEKAWKALKPSQGLQKLMKDILKIMTGCDTITLTNYRSGDGKNPVREDYRTP